MRKSDVAQKISTLVEGVDKPTATAVINAFTEVVKTALSQGEPVTLREFGTFAPKRKVAKIARNITTGETIIIPTHMAPVFTPADSFRQQVRTGLHESTTL